MSDNIGEKFLAFENKNNLFKLRTEDGIYIWDIVRFDLYVNLMWDYTNRPKVRTTIKDKVKLLYQGVSSFIQILLDRNIYDNLFFIFSRSIIENRLLDLASIDTLKVLKNNGDRNFIFESNINPSQQLAVVPTNSVHLQYLYRKLYPKKCSYNFSKIINLINAEFGRCPLGIHDLDLIVHNFISDRSLFLKILRKHKIKKVFITQNGIQKGLLAAAIELNLPTYEFQHGIVDRGHIAYSYPTSNLTYPEVILPQHMFVLGSHWFRGIDFPMTNLISLGNDYFANKSKTKNTNVRDSILVISADIFGLALKDFLLTLLLEVESFKERVFYFKLHPNQFMEMEAYIRYFQNFENVRIVSNAYSVQDLFAICDTLFTIQSTAVYEALQQQMRVILYGVSTYYRHSDVLDDDNVYIVNTVSEFSEVVDNIIVEKEYSFFDSFNSNCLTHLLC